MASEIEMPRIEEMQRVDSETQSVKETGYSTGRPVIYTDLIKSLILAQDERWRRA